MWRYIKLTACRQFSSANIYHIILYGLRTSSTLVVFMLNVSICKSPSVDVLLTSGESRPPTQFDCWVLGCGGAGGGAGVSPITPGNAGLYVDAAATRTASTPPGRAAPGWNLWTTSAATCCCCCCWRCCCSCAMTKSGTPMKLLDSMAAAVRGGSSRPAANDPPRSLDTGGCVGGRGRRCSTGSAIVVLGSAREDDIDLGSSTVNGIRCCPRPTGGDRHVRSATETGGTAVLSSGTMRCCCCCCLAASSCSCWTSRDGWASASRKSLVMGDGEWRVDAAVSTAVALAAYAENRCAAGAAGDRPTADITGGIPYWPTHDNQIM